MMMTMRQTISRRVQGAVAPGKGRGGSVCQICESSGKVPAEDQPDDDREDDENR